MNDVLCQRTSPVHDEIAHLEPRWGHVSNMLAALSFGEQSVELAQAASLGLADASCLLRVVVKGPEAADWLQARGIGVPAGSYGVAWLPGGGQVVRTGREEIFVEDGPEGSIVPGLEQGLRSLHGGGPYEVVRQDACFFLSGARAGLVLAQTCGVDMREPGERLVLSRVAGVSAGIRFRQDLRVPLFQLWTDPSGGPYLWETLHEIVTDLNGAPVGLCCFWPELC